MASGNRSKTKEDYKLKGVLKVEMQTKASCRLKRERKIHFFS